MELAICVVCYNRKFELDRLINCLLQIKSEVVVDLIISIDYSKDQKGVSEIVDSLVWPFGKLIIHKHEHNIGLKQHVLLCGDFSENYDGLVVLEDDLIISPYFRSS